MKNKKKANNKEPLKRLNGILINPKVTIVKSIGNLASDMLRKSLDSFARLDVKTSFSVLESDSEVNEQFQLIIRKLITFVLEDPRTISAALELLTVAKAFERIGDHSKNISGQSISIDGNTERMI